MHDEMDNVEWLRKSASDEWCGSALNKCADEIERLRDELASAKQAAAAYKAWKFPEDIQVLTVENERLREENARLRKFCGISLEVLGALKKVVAMDKQHIALAPETIDKFEDVIAVAEDIASATFATAIREGGKKG